MQYKVRKVSGFEKSDESAFDRLTPQQMRILRLAYLEGYYDIPRKVDTEQLANLLKMKRKRGRTSKTSGEKCYGFLDDNVVS